MQPLELEYDGKSLIIIRSHADLHLQGWEKSQVLVLPSDVHTARVHQQQEELRIVLTADAEIDLPAGARVMLEKVGGDAWVRGLTGTLEINKVGGDCSLQDVGTAQAGWVDGDLQAQNVNGPLQIHKVGGDVIIVDCHGPVNLDAAGGDLQVMEAAGPVSAKIGGDAQVSLLGEGYPVNLRSGGDITLYITSLQDAAVSFTCGGEEIQIEVEGKTEEINQHTFSQIFGNGSVPIRLVAGGSIRLTDSDWDGDDLEAEFAEKDEEWDEWVQDRAERLEEFDRRAEDLVRRVSERTQEATHRAEERMAQAMQRMEERRRRLEERFAGFPLPPIPPIPSIPSIPPIPPLRPGSGKPGTSFAGSAPSPEQKTSRVSADERMLILKMLAEGRITAEEANNLLDALEKGAA